MNRTDSSPATTNDTGTISIPIVPPTSTQIQHRDRLRHIADVLTDVMDRIDRRIEDREANYE